MSIASLHVCLTGPDAPGVVNRDTSVVVQELFAQARHSVLLAGFAVYQGQQVFRALADQIVRHFETLLAADLLAPVF